MESPWAPLRRRMFLVLWLAQLGSNIGTWMQTVGAQWFLVESGANPALISLVQTANLFPALLLGLVAGVLADAFDRRLLVLGANLFAAAAAGILTVLTALGRMAPDSLLLYTFLIGCGMAISSPAWQAIIPSLVPRREIQAASALGSAAMNAARAVGPAGAGVLVSLAGPAFVFGLNTLSFVGTAAAIYAWRPPPLEEERERLGEAFAAGLRYIRAAPRIRRILLRVVLFMVPASSLYALLPVAVDGHLRLGSTGYGLLLGCLGAGAVAGVVLLPRIRKLPDSLVLGAAAGVFGAAAWGAGHLPPVPLGLLLLVGGLAWISTFSTLNAAMQLTLPEWVRARGLAVYLMVNSGSQGLAALFWGSAATRYGYSAVLTFTAVLLLLAGASVLVLPLLPGTGRLDRSVPEPELDLHLDEDTAPRPDAGPVTLLVAYEVAEGELEAFTEAMQEVRLVRLRTGATGWELVRSVTDAEQFREIYEVPTWRQYLRQEHQRITGEDRALIQRAEQHLTEPPRVRWFLPANPG